MAHAQFKIGQTQVSWMRISIVSCLAITFIGAPVLVFAQTKPPCKVGEVTLAGARNYDARILEYSAAKGQYRVKDLKYGDEEWLPARLLKTCQGIAPAPVAISYFTGAWLLFNGGGGAYQKQRSGDWKVIGLDTAKAPPITVKADGSYVWVLDSRSKVEGKWRAAQPNELKDGYDKRGPTILLLNGESGKNWLMSRELGAGADGRDRILVERVDLGLTYHGSRAP